MKHQTGCHSCLTCKWVFGCCHLQRNTRTITGKTPPISEKIVTKLVEDSVIPIKTNVQLKLQNQQWRNDIMSPQSFRLADAIPLLSDVLKKVKVVIIKAKRFAGSEKKRNFASVTVRNYRLPISRCFQTKSRRDASWSVLRWQKFA